MDDLAATLPGRNEVRYGVGRVLEIGVHRDDRSAAGVTEAGPERILMAEVPAEPHAVNPTVLSVELDDGAPRIVGAPIVRHDQLPGAAEALHDRDKPGVQLRDIPALVVRRNYDGDLRRTLPGHRVALSPAGFGSAGMNRKSLTSRPQASFARYTGTKPAGASPSAKSV
jgi:hypothetical protein